MPIGPQLAWALMTGSKSMSAQRRVAAAYSLVRLIAKAPRLISWLLATQARWTPSGPGKIGTIAYWSARSGPTTSGISQK